MSSKKTIHYRWIVTVSIILGIYLALPFMAPVLMHAGLDGPARVIYFIYSWLCHQLPQRSFFLFGPKFTYPLAEIQSTWQNTINPQILRQFIGNPAMGCKVAWSDRMVSMYASLWFFGLIWWFVRRRLKPVTLVGFSAISAAHAGGWYQSLFQRPGRNWTGISEWEPLAGRAYQACTPSCSIPAAGGELTWLTGAVEFGDYDPAGAKNSADVAYASFSPEGQAPRTWVAAFTYDLPAGYWTEGTHSYHFEVAGVENTPEISFDAWDGETLYDGKVLMRSGALRARTGEECISIDHAINPAQPTQFNIGWTADGIYAEALAQLEALMPTVVWDGVAPMSLLQHEVFPFTSQVYWVGYVCSYTYP